MTTVISLHIVLASGTYMVSHRTFDLFQHRVLRMVFCRYINPSWGLEEWLRMWQVLWYRIIDPGDQ